MNELKIFVERCVRPVILEESGKLRMRRELYAHASEAYAQESARTEDTQVALERTLERMGDPKQLTSELQDSIGTLDRWTGHIDALMHRPDKMPLWRYALRVTCYFGSPIVAVLLLLLCWRIVTESLALSEWRFLGAMGVFWLFNLFVLSAIYGKVFDVLEQERWTGKRTLLTALLAVVTAGDVLVGGSLFTLLASGSVDFSRQVLPYWGILAGLGAVAMVVVSWLSVVELRGLKEWRELEIEG